MFNNKLRDFIAEEHEDSYVFNLPSFDNSIVGITDNGRIVYCYELMVKEFMHDAGVSEEDAVSFIDYNTLRSIDYIEESIRPLIIYNQKLIKELIHDSGKT